MASISGYTPSIQSTPISMHSLFETRFDQEMGSQGTFLNNVIRSHLSGQSPIHGRTQSLNSLSGNTMNLQGSAYEFNESFNNLNQSLALFQHYNKLFSSCFRSF